MVKHEKQWIKEHCVSYTFIIDEFQPNPDSDLFELMQAGTFNQPMNQPDAVFKEAIAAAQIGGPN